MMLPHLLETWRRCAKAPFLLARNLTLSVPSRRSVVLAAAAGCVVAKAGNRSVSSACGSADVLEALGVKVDLSPKGVEECVEKTNIAFMFAPVNHPSMR